MKMIVHVNGTPWPQMRARHTKNGRTYKAPAQAQAEAHTVMAMMAAKNGAPPITGPVNMFVRFVFQRPASHFGTGRNVELKKAVAPDHHVKKPDLDNLVKHVKDCGTQAGLWVDDCQVVYISATKVWGELAITEVEITGV